jgi:enoyl-CoA hydratase/carnithine racemase
VNALNTALWDAIGAAIDRLGADESVHCGILTGAGSRAFCAGADVKELTLPDPTTRSHQHYGVMLKIAEAALPLICAINGPTVGAGVVIATLCDYRIAADTAHFSWTEIDRGLTSGGGVHMRKIGVPEGAIREMLFTGRRVAAVEAVGLNLISKSVPYEDLMSTAMEAARQIASKPRTALVTTKKAMLIAEVHANWREGYLAARSMAGELYGKPETVEGISAFLEKRQPEYSKDV